jgi:hypothetical protein
MVTKNMTFLFDMIIVYQDMMVTVYVFNVSVYVNLSTVTTVIEFIVFSYKEVIVQ